MLRIRIAVRAIGIRLVQVAGIRQQDRTQIKRRLGTVNPSLEPVLDQQRHVTAVIDMGVGKYNRINGIGGYRQRRPVSQAQFLQSLKEPAINQGFAVALFKQIFRSGNGAGCAEELQSHGRISL